MTKSQLEAPPAVATAPLAHPIVITLALLAPVPVLTGQFTGTALDPLSSTISQYAHQPGGYPMVLLGALLLAGCAVVIVVDLIGRPAATAVGAGAARIVSAVTGAGRHRLGAATLLVSYAAALTVVGLVPTDPPGSMTVSVPEIVHRVGVAWAFVSLPIAGIVLARAPRLLGSVSSAALTRAAGALLVGVLVFGAVQLPLLAAGSGIPGLGLVERIAFVFMIGYLIALSVALGMRGRGVAAS